MSDILLVQPPIRDYYLTRKRTIPYGLACIAAAAMRNGFSVEILDALSVSKSRPIDTPSEMDYLHAYYGRPDRSPFALFHQFRHYGYSFDTVGKKARENGAFLVGISSLFTPYAEEALRTAEAIRQYHPDCRIVMGGHHPSACPREVMQNKAVDFILRGEGEASLPVLAAALKNGSPLDRVPGIVYRKPDGALFVAPPAFHEPLEAPSLQLLQDRYYKRGKHNSAVVVCTRGCPMDCSYCCVGRSSKIPYRRREISSVLAEIDQAVENDVRFIDFEDENLSLDKTWFRELLTRLYKKYGGLGIELRAMNGIYPGSLDRESVEWMGKAGFRSLNLALASAVPVEFKRFNRPDVRKDFDRALAHAEEFGLEATGYVIAGAPFQQPENSVYDLLYLAQRRVLAAVSAYYPAPGSRDYESCRLLGILPQHTSLMRSTALPISNRTTRIEAITILRLGRILNFMKSLLDTGSSIPEPKLLQENQLADTENRREIGIMLLADFFASGKIRGVQPDGRVFAHQISGDLAQVFLQGLRREKIRGVRA
jgi:anaerobic magnesium-protoporphyrin IX monomethyl ester cyclase